MEKQRTETWRDVVGYRGRYQVSNFGRIKSFPVSARKPFVLTNIKTSTGYWQVNLKGKAELVHRLVAQAFIPNPDGKPQINHKDGDGLNNRIQNLEWVTGSENTQHAYDVLGVIPEQLGKFGKDHNASKPVDQLTLDDQLVRRWESGMDAVRAGFESGCISRCCLGTRRTHSGFKWRYAKN